MTSISSDNTFLVKDIQYDHIRDFAILSLDHNLTQANYSLYIKYNGEISNNLYGFYQSSYTDEFNKTL